MNYKKYRKASFSSVIRTVFEAAERICFVPPVTLFDAHCSTISAGDNCGIHDSPI